VCDPLLGLLHRSRERRFAQDQLGQGGDGHSAPRCFRIHGARTHIDPQPISEWG
jgi:hypothetical protein